MNRILSLDLGTASIGWAVREKSHSPSIEDIIESGVVIFPEGYGSVKGNQFSLASERRKKRLIRRGYYRRKLRKYATLKVLIENGLVPLSIEELRAWIKPARGEQNVHVSYQ
ncbi:MAG: hypothetical protein IPP17_15935 [Bacteroidetes bacterium]|nr:hypothetical protein [Bacteroidota bacterium]